MSSSTSSSECLKPSGKVTSDMGRELLFYRNGTIYGEWSAVHEAAAHNNLPAMEILLRHDPRNKDLLHVRTAKGKTPLVLALDNPKTTPAMIKLLLDAGSDANIGTVCGPPLWHAVQVGNFEIVQLLVTHGAWPMDHDQEFTALHYAATSCNLQLMKYFLQKCDYTRCNAYNETALYCACTADFTAGVELLVKNAVLDSVINLDACSGFGYQPFEKRTLEKKMKKRMMNRCAIRCYSPLVVAVMQGNRQMVELLLEAGATVTVGAVQYCFMSEGNVDVLRVLVGASFSAVYNTLSYEGCEMDDVEQLQYMMQVLHNHVDCDLLERTILDMHEGVLDLIIHGTQGTVFKHLNIFFEHNFTYEGADLFRKVQKYPAGIVGLNFLRILSEIGIRGCSKEKQAVLEHWVGQELDGFGDAVDRSTIEGILGQPVLDLKRQSAIVARAHIRNYTGSNWMARLMVQESALPSICKQQLFLQFASVPHLQWD